MRKLSDLIGHPMKHKTAPDITGQITDVLFGFALRDVAFILADITTPDGTAPLLLSPTVLDVGEDGIMMTAHPDDIVARVDAAIHRLKVPMDPTAFPSTFIGPFGNTFSPSMIAALFNARTNGDGDKPKMQDDGVWFSELHGHAISAHIATVARLSDIILDDQLATCEAIEIAAGEDGSEQLKPQVLKAARTADNGLLLSLVQTDAGDGAR